MTGWSYRYQDAVACFSNWATRSVGFVIEKIKWTSDYDRLFETAFGGAPSADRIGAALASYQRTLISANSRFDKWRYGGNPNALTAQEIKGFKLFSERAKCSSCHQIGDTSAIFSDQTFNDIGYGWMRHQEAERRGQTPLDLGRFEVT